MPTFLGRLAMLSAFAIVIATVGPAGARKAPVCNLTKAASFAGAGDRLSANGRYANAARSYLAAAGSSDDCRSASERLTYVRFLARAGVAFGQSGDYSRALEIMNAAQAQLTALAADDRAISSAAHALLDVIGDAIATINLAARFSM